MPILRGPRAPGNAAVGACLALVVLLASPVGAVAGAPRPKLPPALVALEQKMTMLRINTERGTIVESLSGVSLADARSLLEVADAKQPRQKGKAGASSDAAIQLPLSPPLGIPMLTADFEVSDSPRLLLMRAEVLGALSLQVRVIGEQEYERSSLLDLLFGSSKPWIYISPAERSKEQREHGGEAESPATEAHSGFSKLIARIARARSVVEVGPAAVDGQQTTEFRASFEIKRHASASILGSSKASRRKRLVRARETLDLFLAPDGLPVRTRERVQVGEARLDVTEDVLATEIPVTVTAPPGSETISQAELQKSVESGTGHPPTKREEAEERRFAACVNKRLGKHPSKAGRRKLTKTFHECERAAKRKSKK